MEGVTIGINCAKGTWDLSQLFLATAYEPTTIPKKKKNYFFKKATFVLPLVKFPLIQLVFVKFRLSVSTLKIPFNT